MSTTPVTVTTLTCQRCGYTWLPRIAVVRQCPKCKSAWFDTPKPPSPNGHGKDAV